MNSYIVLTKTTSIILKNKCNLLKDKTHAR